MTDRYQRLRGALAAGPTPGPWKSVPGSGYDYGSTDYGVSAPPPHYWIVPTLNIPKVNTDYIAAASPDTIAELLAERDRWVVAGREWHNKTEWLQTNAINPRYLGMHRADILRDQIERLTAERDALREALAVARDYVANEVVNRRIAYRGYESHGKVPEAEADLARIDTALGEGNE